MAKTLFIASSKGGVGKTTTAINLSSALLSLGRDTILLDASLESPNLALHLGSGKLGTTVHDLLKSKIPPQRSIHLHPSGLRVIPGSISVDRLTHADYGALAELIPSIARLADWLIIDTPPGLTDSHRKLFNNNELLIVTSPTVPSVAESLRTIRFAENNGATVLGIVINGATATSQLDEKNVEAICGKPVLMTIPHLEEISSATALNHPISFLFPNSSADGCYKSLAAFLCGVSYEPSQERKAPFYRKIGAFIL